MQCVTVTGLNGVTQWLVLMVIFGHVDRYTMAVKAIALKRLQFLENLPNLRCFDILE